MPPHRGPTDHPGVVPCLEAGLDPEVPHKDIEVSGEASIESGRHGVRDQLEEQGFMVGRPRRRPALIGKIQAPTIVHGPHSPSSSYLLRRGSAPWGGGTVTISSQS